MRRRVLSSLVLAVVLQAGCASPRPAAAPAPPPTPPPDAIAPAAIVPAAIVPDTIAPDAAPPEAVVAASSGGEVKRRATPPPPALPPGCRHAQELRCSGMAPREGEPDETTVVVCDECNGAGDCTAAAQGRCIAVGGERCAGPSRRVCRYGPPCDPRKQKDCPDQSPPAFPPSRGGGGD